MPYVRIKNGPAQGTAIEVTDQPITIGRDPTCTIQIMDKGASRQHSEIFRIGEMCFIRDLQSRNGTYVNDNRVEEELLREGDRVVIGATILVFEGAEKRKSAAGEDVEFSEEEVGSTLELRLEDLASFNVGEGDGSEAQRLRALYRLGRIIGAHHHEAPLIEEALPFAAEQLRAESAYLFLRDPVKGSIVPIGTWMGGKRKQASKVSRSIIRRAIQEKRALLTSDAMQDNRFSAQESIVMKEIHSVICVPLSVTGALSGVLYLAADNPSTAFTDEELELAAAMADQIGLALAHLRTQAAQRDSLMSTIRVLVRAAEMRDPSSQGRSERIAGYAFATGRQLGLGDEMLEDLQLAGLLHDVGALVSTDADDKDATPTDGATSAAHRIEATLSITRDMECHAKVEKAIRYHLERYDGSGPEGLAGDDIPVAARVLGLAVVFEEMMQGGEEASTTSAILRDAMVEVGGLAGRAFDEEVTQAMLIAHRDGSLHVPLDEQRKAASARK